LHLITGILTGEGVPWRVRSRRVPQLPVSYGLLGAAEIYVPKAEAPVAQRILMIYRNHCQQDDGDGVPTAHRASPARRRPHADLP